MGKDTETPAAKEGVAQGGANQNKTENHAHEGGRGAKGGRGRGKGGKGNKGGGGRGRGAGKGGRRAGHGIDHGGGVYSKGGGKGPRMRGSHVGPGTFGCGRLGMVFFAFRFLQRRMFGKKKKKKKPQGNQQGHKVNNQPYVGQPQPYVPNAAQSGEEKVAEEAQPMPVAVGVPVEK